MATLLALKRRIQAAQNVSKTTRALQMISASKLKKAQSAATSAQPYVSKLSALTQEISDKIGENFSHPYVHTSNTTGKTLLLVISPDKGLCGGLITNLLREFRSYKRIHEDSTFIVVGKKLEGYVARTNNEIIAAFKFGTTMPPFESMRPLIKIIDEYYTAGKVDSVKILSTKFNSIFTQKPYVTTLLPIVLPKNEEAQREEKLTDYTVEPSAQDLLPYLVKHYVEMVLYQHILESFVSEQASRMIAMQNATNNAKDVIQDLRLEYNKSRQAKITSEILDISAGAVVTHE